MAWFLRLMVIVLVLLIPGGMVAAAMVMGWQARRRGQNLPLQDAVAKLGQYWTEMRWSRASLEAECTTSTK